MEYKNIFTLLKGRQDPTQYKPNIDIEPNEPLIIKKKCIKKKCIKKKCINCGEKQKDGKMYTQMSKKVAYKGWCCLCADIDDGLMEWSFACWDESLKENPNEDVFRGYY